MSQTASTTFCKVVIEGLQKVEDVKSDDSWSATIGDESGLYNLSLNLHEDDSMWPKLWRTIQAYGFEIPQKLLHGEVEYRQFAPLHVVREHDEVQVVADDQPSTPTTIKMSETLISHTNAHHVSPVEFDLGSYHVSHGNKKHGLSISFERTIRIPDDNKLHHLPSSLGSYRLFSVDSYSKYLPKNVTKVGGVFFSMWQREAMWISFQDTFRKYAVRVFVGRVNAITGQEMQNEKDTKKDDYLQDYVVVPGQQWLDGICVAPGVVRQFVAMPLGSGYTVEGQKTSEEKHGGLQIEVTPQMEHGKRSWTHGKQQHLTTPVGNASQPSGLNEYCTPRELGCEIGDVLRSYPANKESKRPFQIQDLFAPKTEGNGKCSTVQDNDSISVATVTLKAVARTHTLSLREGADMSSFQSSSPRPRSSTGQTYGYSINNADSSIQQWYNPVPLASPPAPLPIPAPQPIPNFETPSIPPQTPSSAPPPPPPPPPPPRPAPPRPPPSVQIASSEPQTRPAPPRPVHTPSRAPPPLSVVPQTRPAPPPPASGVPKLPPPPPSSRAEHSLSQSIPTPPQPPEGNRPQPADKVRTDFMELTEEQAKSVKTLGLAAGGKLIQDIYKDPFPATTWNHAGARILYVHMLDPESCEKVTHIASQPPPVATEEYVKSGGSFYVIEEKVDERLDGGDFDNVKSVSQMDQHLGVTTEPEFDPKKPKMCTTCERRLCDCIIRPCNHQFCNICIKRLEDDSAAEQSIQHWKCPTCNSPVSHVAGFSAPMNLPGEERLLRTKVEVNVLKIEDGRARFSSVQKSRV